jgi:uncharacterized membrane protein YkoI
MKMRWSILVLALLATSPALGACLSDRQARAVIGEIGGITLRDVMQIATSEGGELVSARLCDINGRYVYRVAVIDPDGRVTRLVIDATNGNILRGS